MSFSDLVSGWSIRTRSCVPVRAVSRRWLVMVTQGHADPARSCGRASRGVQRDNPIRNAVTGDHSGSHQRERLPTQANGCGRADGDHPRPRTDPDDAERLIGIYGSAGAAAGSRAARRANGSANETGWDGGDSTHAGDSHHSCALVSETHTKSRDREDARRGAHTQR